MGSDGTAKGGADNTGAQRRGKTMNDKPLRWTVPASFFGMVLGLTGLGTNWRVAAKLWGLPAWVGEAVMAVAVAVWAVLALLYALKWLRAGAQARGEIEHPIQCCFVALVPVTTMLVGIAVLPYSRPAALLLCGVGALAANLMSAIAAAALGWPELGQLFLGAGVLAWLALESIIIGRLLTAEELPQPLRPTLGIQAAPPAVALLAYCSVTTGPPDLVAHGLLGYALVQACLALRLLPWIRQPFTPGYWAFTFAATAITSATMRYADRGGDWVFVSLAPVLFVLANVIVGGMGIATALRGRMLPSQAAPIAR